MRREISRLILSSPLQLLSCSLSSSLQSLSESDITRLCIGAPSQRIQLLYFLIQSLYWDWSVRQSRIIRSTAKSRPLPEMECSSQVLVLRTDWCLQRLSLPRTARDGSLVSLENLVKPEFPFLRGAVMEPAMIERRGKPLQNCLEI